MDVRLNGDIPRFLHWRLCSFGYSCDYCFFSVCLWKLFERVKKKNWQIGLHTQLTQRTKARLNTWNLCVLIDEIYFDFNTQKQVIVFLKKQNKKWLKLFIWLKRRRAFSALVIFIYSPSTYSIFVESKINNALTFHCRITGSILIKKVSAHVWRIHMSSATPISLQRRIQILKKKIQTSHMPIL